MRGSFTSMRLQRIQRLWLAERPRFVGAALGYCNRNLILLVVQAFTVHGHFTSWTAPGF